ncbi:MAG: tRNA preQ1(34) S-adenosylmethionine ribosyltransferase-isomerase QueA [Proteobacteria bacterium]|nr:MAG: tRNA preQ1(34) S-adenosylmethionine ribosyltransferase-isomerase QueA [Pseudomonadota bacterium]
MDKKDFAYDLPKALIAQQPITQRSQSRLLVLDKNSGEVRDCQFTQIGDYLKPGDLLVFNNTKVMPARLQGQKKTGGQIEVFIERILNEHQAKALLKANKSVRLGTEIYFNDRPMLQVTGRQGMFFLVETLDKYHDINRIMEKHGVMPLPPYIQRDSTESDSERYQTVYAETAGAVAAPTAGLHFDDKTLNHLKAQGINSAFVTLHVGAGTFQPVKADHIEDHKIHKEWLQVDETVVDAVKETKANGGRIIAVGTTAVRCLETAAQNGKLKAYTGDTDIFIYPGYNFKVIDGLLTNFHLPESTLLMLVSALAGRKNILNAYQHAIDQQYRFFSYGDAMLIVDSTD